MNQRDLSARLRGNPQPDQRSRGRFIQALETVAQPQTDIVIDGRDVVILDDAGPAILGTISDRQVHPIDQLPVQTDATRVETAA